MTKKISHLLILLRAFIPSIYFCLKYLPFRQAIKLPILVYKPHFLKLEGTVVIENENIRFGMVKLGFLTHVLYPNTGITVKKKASLYSRGNVTLVTIVILFVESKEGLSLGMTLKCQQD